MPYTVAAQRALLSRRGVQRGVVGVGSGFTTLTADTSYYLPLGAAASVQTSQALGSFAWRGAGVLRNMHVTVSINSRNSSATTVTLQRGGADTALSASIPASSTATASNTTDVVSVSDGDVLTLHVRTNTGTGTITIRSVTLQFEREGQIFTHVSMFQATQSISSERFVTPGGDDNPTATEADARWRALEPCTISRIFATLTASAADCTVTSRKNSAAGNQSILIPSGTTTRVEEDDGVFDTLADGDTFDIRKVASGAAVTLAQAGLRYESQVPGRVMVGTGGGVVASSGATTYGGMFGPPLVGTTESQAKQKIPYAALISRLACTVITNLSTATPVLTLRVNGVDTAVTSTVTATGTISTPATASVAVAAGDDISVSISGHDGNVTLGATYMLVTDLNAGA
jgi:hypothetical protein